MQLSDEFYSKMYERDLKSRRDQSDVQSGFNKWLFSLKKSKFDHRKYYERCKSSDDPNRVLWAHVNEVKSTPLVARKNIRQAVKSLDTSAA